MKDVEGTVHFLNHMRFRMACNRRPEESYSSTSFWEQVTCKDCLAEKIRQRNWPRASVVRAGTSWQVIIHFNGNWRQSDSVVCYDDDQNEAIKDALWLIERERSRASFNARYEYIPIHAMLLRARRVEYEASKKYGSGTVFQKWIR